MPGAAGPARSFELSQLRWGHRADRVQRGALARAGDVDKAEAGARSITDRHELPDLQAHQTGGLLGVNEPHAGR